MLVTISYADVILNVKSGTASFDIVTQVVKAHKVRYLANKGIPVPELQNRKRPWKVKEGVYYFGLYSEKQCKRFIGDLKDKGISITHTTKGMVLAENKAIDISCHVRKDKEAKLLSAEFGFLPEHKQAQMKVQFDGLATSFSILKDSWIVFHVRSNEGEECLVLISTKPKAQQDGALDS